MLIKGECPKPTRGNGVVMRWSQYKLPSPDGLAPRCLYHLDLFRWWAGRPHPQKSVTDLENWILAVHIYETRIAYCSRRGQTSLLQKFAMHTNISTLFPVNPTF